MEKVVLEGDCSLISSFEGDLALFSNILGEVGIFTEVHTDVQYTGEYTVTPSSDQQVLQTRDMVCYDNITVEPIPSNYGLITWNGSSLTVS